MTRTVLQVPILVCLLVSFPSMERLQAGETLPPVSKRYSGQAQKPAEAPDFRKHVIPLLGRLGCNGRACHGSFQGQGGFRLSLFGYDFSADHAALVAGEEPRVNIKRPEASLILQKPTAAIDHEGGKRFPSGGWEYRLLASWVAAGAKGVQEELAAPELHVSPNEILFVAGRNGERLKVVAEWPDGTREDVTPLCRFRTNDESVAKVDATGTVTRIGQGDTHVVVFYDNGIVPVPVIAPFDKQEVSRPRFERHNRIDDLVLAKLQKVGIVPAEKCRDDEFLRRVSLDLTGTLPAPEEVTSFLADSDETKRVKKVNELLARPTYSAWWATRMGDWLGNSDRNLPVGGEQGLNRAKSQQWYDWLERRLRENAPYDRIVEGIVMATSRRGEQTMEEYYAEMSSYFRDHNPADFAARESMPYFWTRGRFTPPQPLRFSYAFLGVRLECAQCHKHPYDQWTKEDYESFQAFFSGVGFRYDHGKPVKALKKKLGLTADQDSGGYKRLFAKLARAGTVVPWGEVNVPTPERQRLRAKRNAKVRGGRVFTPKLLGGEEVLSAEYKDARAPLMEWLKQPENPYFASAVVNRIWASYFGVGIIDPPDDMNLANAASNRALLDYLSTGFVTNKYDLRWLHREIAGSRTYQSSWRPNKTNLHDRRNFSRALVRRLPAEVARDALVQATAAEKQAALMQTDSKVVRERSIGASSGVRDRSTRYVLELFGKPARDGVCDCQRSNDSSLLQTVYLRNDAEMLKMIDRRDGWLAEFSNKGNWTHEKRNALIRTAYLRSFSRPPSEKEIEVAAKYFASAENSRTGLRDLLWALLNSKEFILNH